jgi:Leucine-rich repeat (LRR) protein
MSNKLLVGLIVILVIAGAGYGGYQLRDDKEDTPSSGSSTSSSTETSTQPQTKGKTADYSGRGLTSFPKQALSDTSITDLDLSNNALSGALPGEIRNLTNLESLDVSNNNMTGIPAEIGQLRRLKSLNYSNNQITGLPNELGNLTQLEVFDLSGNNVSQQDLAQIRAKLTNTQFKL